MRQQLLSQAAARSYDGVLGIMSKLCEIDNENAEEWLDLARL